MILVPVFPNVRKNILLIILSFINHIIIEYNLSFAKQIIINYRTIKAQFNKTFTIKTFCVQTLVFTELNFCIRKFNLAVFSPQKKSFMFSPMYIVSYRTD